MVIKLLLFLLIDNEGICIRDIQRTDVRINSPLPREDIL